MLRNFFLITIKDKDDINDDKPDILKEIESEERIDKMLGYGQEMYSIDKRSRYIDNIERLIRGFTKRRNTLFDKDNSNEINILRKDLKKAKDKLFITKLRDDLLKLNISREEIDKKVLAYINASK